MVGGACTALGGLRDLLERRHQITTDLERAERCLRTLPGEIRHTAGQQREAEQIIAELKNRRQVREAVIAQFDPPLRWRRHEQELLAARRELEGTPGRLDAAAADRFAVEQALGALRLDIVESRDYLSRRPESQAEIGAIDDDFDHDLRIRTRVTRRERPEQVVAVLGVRPAHGHGARQWDLAVGELAQHQAAFNVVDGLGPEPHYDDRSAYADSHARVAQLLVPSDRPREMSIDRPELGLSI